MPVKFNKRKLSDLTYESAAVFDVDGDGILDIVSGEYWFKGPEFKEKFKICDIVMEGEYYDDFSNFPLDVNGNGRLDIITGGWWGAALKWRENPGNTGEWATHTVDECGHIETTRFFDIDGCGTVEIFPNTPMHQSVFYKLVKDSNGKPTGEFTKHVMNEAGQGHGMGFGDIDGDGKVEILLCNGYLKQTSEGVFGKWEKVDAYDCGMMTSVPMIAHDVTGNGKMDIIYGSAHNYGLFWLEQKDDGTFENHVIDIAAAQYHDMQMVDIDGDGQLELVTGKRYRAHCGGDPGDNDCPGLYYYKVENGTFVRHVIDFGEVGEASGTGIYMWIADLNGNGKLDIVAPGKEGLYLFENLG